MKKQIDNPKVFISYAWSSKDYQNRVLAFANSLMSDGIDVILDKWSLQEGNNTFAFMEKSVTDDSVTNVLILLDPVYEQKANNHEGGVGTETQIISPEIYTKTDQTKFLPIVFEKHPDGKIPKPAFLSGTYHFDLSDEDTFDEEYMRLIRSLYGVETYRKPELGVKPKWVDLSENSIEYKQLSRYQYIKKASNQNDREIYFKTAIKELIQRLVAFDFKQNESLKMYEEISPLRADLLSLLKLIPYVQNCVETVSDAFEEGHMHLSPDNSLASITKKTLIHELFIYLVIICYKGDLFAELGQLLNRSYYTGTYGHEMTTFCLFYCNNQMLDQSVNKRDGKHYLSGTANYWMETIDIDICSKYEFVFADLICYNASIFLHNNYSDWYWFPITYVYMTNEYESLIKKFAMQLQSKAKATKAALIFGFDDCESFKRGIAAIEKGEKEQHGLEGVRYMNSFESPHMLFQFIEADAIASQR